MKKTPKTIKYISLFISLMIIAFFIFSIIYYTRFTQSITSLASSNYLIIFLISVFLEGFPQLASPTLILTSVILLKASIHGIIFTIALASFIGSCAGYSIGKKYTEKALYFILSENYEEKLKKTKKVIDKYGKIGLFIIAITPFPYFPVIFGTLDFPKKDFLLFGAIPRTASYIVYGYFIYFIT